MLSNIGSLSNHKDHQHHRKIPTKYEPTDFLQLYKEPFTIMIKTEERGRGMSSEETEMVQKAEGSLKLSFQTKKMPCM